MTVTIPRRIGKWTALKLEYLDHYLQAYVTAATRAGETHYIDAFAGCGECLLVDNGYPIPGSPWRALSAVPAFSECHFVEKQARLAAYLRRTLAQVGVEDARVYPGDCNDVLPSEVLPRVPRNVPSFAFLDPTGLQLHWQTIQKLAAHRTGRKMELLILYPYDMAIARLFNLARANPSTYNTLVRFYGDECWVRELAESEQAGEDRSVRRERFVRLYTSNLLALGYRYVRPYGPMYTGRKPLYHVVFASDAEVGARIMHDVWAKIRYVRGELLYRPLRRPSQKASVS